MSNVNNKLFLFGGSGPHAFCFNDLYTFDPETSSWEHCNNFRDLETNPNPKARAGHSMTLVGYKLYIIGGSYGQDYLKDVHILDTDPCPEFTLHESDSLENPTQQKFFKGVLSMLNQEEFSDVIFKVDGKNFYGHRIIISQLSEKFKAMFSGSGNANGGFAESKKSVIEINNISYPIFTQIMKYLYSGKFDLGPQISNTLKMYYQEVDKLNERSVNESMSTMQDKQLFIYQHQAIEQLIDFLRVADEYLLEDVKNHC